VLSLSAAIATGCGRDDDTREAAPAAPPRGDLQRFCNANEELQRSADRFFSKRLGRGEPSPAEMKQAHLDFIERSRSQIAEVEQAAPNAVRNEVALVLDGMRAQAGLAKVDEREVDAADKRLTRYGKEKCS